MMRFAENFNDFQIVTELASKLSWSHFIEILPLKSNEARLFYANESAERRFGTKELRRQISRKAFERREIANTQVSDASNVPFNVFKDPYLLDVLELKDNFAEADLEKAILLILGQMRFYLKWLDRYERQEHENPPIGIILCTAASREQVELLELDKEGIAVAEYWTSLPPKTEFECKIKEILSQAKERLARRKLLASGEVLRNIEYFYETKDDDYE